MIGADGANSVVARSLGLRRGKTIAAAIEVEVPAPPEVRQRFAGALCFIFGEVPLGYLWVFPKAEHLSIGIGALRPGPGQLQATLRRVMAGYGLLLDGVPLHGHPIPIYMGSEKLSTRRVLLVGDAAGLADPLTGEGIHLAIKSSELAARAIRQDCLDRYGEWIHRSIGRSHSIGLALAWLFYHFPRTCLQLGARNPFITRTFVDMLSDRIGYPGTLMTIVTTTPAHLALEGVLALMGLVAGPERTRRLRRAIDLAEAHDRWPLPS